MKQISSASLLRERKDGSEARVGSVELFFDLVFVFAVTQLSHFLLHHLTPLGAVQTCLLLMAVWSAELLKALMPEGLLPSVAEISVDWRVLAFSLTLAVLTSILFGLVPALRASRLPFRSGRSRCRTSYRDARSPFSRRHARVDL
jgi:low temperature requirement protein LtrA